MVRMQLALFPVHFNPTGSSFRQQILFRPFSLSVWQNMGHSVTQQKYIEVQKEQIEYEKGVSR